LNVIPKEQSGFRAKHSTTDKIVRLQTAVNDAFRKSHKVLAVFVDLEKAFDMVWREGLLHQLELKGIKGCLTLSMILYITEQ
jgi:hypothetical protein